MKKKCVYKPSILAIILLFCCTTLITVSAKNIYLSAAEGLDTNNGLTPQTAVKTICKAMTIAATNDVIKIDGMVNLENEPHKTGGRGDVNLAGTSILVDNDITYNVWIPTGENGTAPIGLLILNKNLIFEGSDKETCGFDAHGKSTVCRIDGLVGSATFRNLTFTGGNNVPSGDSGAGLYLRSTGALSFENCKFTNNKNLNSGNDQGGAVIINAGSPSFRSCYFADNLNKKGSAIAVVIGSAILDSCIIENHDASAINGSQGAIFLSASQQVNLFVTATVFKNNKAVQGGALFVEDQANATTAINATIESCAFIGNESSSGGAIFVNNRNDNQRPVNISFVNSTFYDNKLTANYGSSVVTVNAGKTGGKLNFTNCTITKNTASFLQGAAFRFQNNSKDMQKSFYNCIIEDNFGQTANLDIYFESATADKNFVIKNSFIGTAPASFSAVDYPGNELNYFASSSSKAGFQQPVADFITAQNCIPLANISPAVLYGAAEYLRDSLEFLTDQLGRVRAFTDGKCALGSVETNLSPSGYAERYLHFIMYGQSHSVAAQSYPPLSVVNVPGNYMTGIQVWNGRGNNAADKNNFNPLVSAIPANAKTAEKNKNLIGEASLTGAVNHIQLKTQGTEAASKILATVCGQEGLTIEQLSKNGPSVLQHLYETDFLPSLDYAFLAARRPKIQLYCPAIFWLQGESNQNWNQTNGDEERATTTAGYKAALLQLKQDMQTDIMNKYGQTEAPAFITYQMSGEFLGNPQELYISTAHVEAANENEDIICAGPVYPITHHTSPGSHYDANGYRWYGEMLGKVYYKTQVLKETFKPLQPIAFYGVTDEPNKLRIKFHVPAPPLVLDTFLVINRGDYGFEVFKNGTKKTITEVAVDNNDVIITLSETISLADNIEITYAGATKKFGNLRDSDPYEAFYEYEDLDRQVNNEFVYPRGKEPNSEIPVTTLRPVFEPKDTEGNVIYGQKYPLYNFSVAFYKKIAAGNLQYDSNSALEEPASNKKIKVYVSGYNLIVNAGNNAVEKVEIFNLSGGAVKILETKQTASYSLATLPYGVYVAKVTTNVGVFVNKVIKK